MISAEQVITKCKEEHFLRSYGMGTNHIEKHFGDIENVTNDIDRLFKEKMDAVSHFVKDEEYLNNDDEPYGDFEYLENIVGLLLQSELQENLDENRLTFLDDIDVLHDWEKFPKTLHFDGWQASVGVVWDKKNNRLVEKETEYVTIVFRRNRDMYNGFSIITAYPDLSKGKETGRNISEDLHKTSVYKEGDLVDKAFLNSLVSDKTMKPQRIGGKNNPGLIYILEKDKVKTISVIMRKDRLIFKITKHDKSLRRRFAEQDLTDPKNWERFKEIYPNFVKNSDIEQHREALIRTMDLEKNGPKVDDDPFGRQ